ncbi:MAG: penicillin-binding protein 2 [Actinobacteria bacterium]|nr:penicillin-binding protein 2 [Actinomycetota bacterium]
MDSEYSASLNPPPPIRHFRLEISLLVVIILVLVALLVRCAFLQLGSVGARCRDQALRQQSQVLYLPSRRGSILDRLGRVLAADVRATGVFADPQILSDPPSAAEQLSGLLAIPSPELLTLIRQADGRRFVWLKRDVPDSTAQRVRDLGIRGIALQSYQRRVYPQGSLAGQLLGFTGLDGSGLEGLERKFDRELTGTDGRQQSTSDPRRRTLFSSADTYRSVRDGANLVLTIDSVIQHITETQLLQACTKYQAKWGLALVMDPSNGRILALANWPSFSPAEFRTSTPQQRRNRCLSDVFEPGSTFKPFIAAKALELGLFSLDDEIFCHNGLYRTGSRTLRDHGAGYGTLSFEDVVVHSSNIGMAIVGQRLGNSRLSQAVRSFGFGQETGIDLAGESVGLVAPLKDWTSYSTTSIPMGQEVAVTGLQLLRAFCAFANDGLLYRPTIVREVVSPNGQVFWRQVPDENPQRVLDPEVAQLMRRRVLANVVERGTGTRAKISGWRVFGKTGTSQVPGPGGYLPDAFVGSFLGGAPLDNPRLCVLVSIGQPDRSIGYYGGTVAAPAVGSILQQSLAYLGVPTEPQPTALAPQTYSSSHPDLDR